MADIKKYFENGQPFKLSKNISAQDVKEEVESLEYVAARLEEKERFVPNVDFSKPENFAMYGSAEEYYDNSFKYIYNSYPYDGSNKEKTLWRLSASYIDLYIFESVYPRTTGHVNFGVNASYTTPTSNLKIATTSNDEYIMFYGGPHADPNLNYKSEKTTGYGTAGISKANIYHSASNRTNNLRCNPNDGITVEFWLKKQQFAGNDTKEAIFDLWNSGSTSTALQNDDDYGRITIITDAATPNKIGFIMASGSFYFGDPNQSGFMDTGLPTIADGEWHHYAFVNQNTGSQNITYLYVDGSRRAMQSTGSTASRPLPKEISGPMVATVGANVVDSLVVGIATNDELHTLAGTEGSLGSGKLTGSVDEFRYWKTARSAKDIGRNWNGNVHGGTNTDDSNTSLGVYYKFNEGVTGYNSVDSKVLDYSGRISNGKFVGYVSGSSRDLASAIDSYRSASYTEHKDPIVYSFHPDVSGTIATYKKLGRDYDHNNNASMYYSAPSWLIEEDESGGEETKKLMQIMSSFFDTLHIQIGDLNKLKFKTYDTGSMAGKKYYDTAIKSLGFVAPEIFADAELIEKFERRDDDSIFYDKDIDQIKDQIYQNIYNNLDYILKSKGTEKSFRNILRCFGVDEELIKINLYASNTVYNFEDNFTEAATKKKFINFNDVNNFGATIVQDYDELSLTTPYISSSGVNIDSTGYPFTMECEFILPNRFPQEHINYFPYTNLSSSIFGIHNVNVGNLNAGIKDSSDFCNLQVYAVREHEDYLGIKSAYFHLTGNIGNEEINLRSSFSASSGHVRFDDSAYEDTRWSVAVKVKPSTYPFASSVSGSAYVSGLPLGHGYDVEFQGVRTFLDIVEKEFNVSASIPYDSRIDTGLNNPKRIYAGAHRQDFTGSLLTTSDIKLGSVRFWQHYLDQNIIRNNALDNTTYGTEKPYTSAYLFQNNHLSGNSISIPEIETLALHWDFSTVTASNDSGQIYIKDLSSGSLNDHRFGYMSSILSRQHSGKGINFESSSDKIVENKYINVAKRQLPENISSTQTIQLLNEDDELFTRDMRPEKYFISVEKNMYQNISEEMIKMFGTIKEFNNLVGPLVYKYRKSYKSLEKLRQLFFEKVKNVPDAEKYFTYYRWVDESISKMIERLFPATSNSNENVFNVIESHVFERNKYQHKFPRLDRADKSYESNIKQISQNISHFESSTPILTFPDIPNPALENISPLYWKKKAEKTNNPVINVTKKIDLERDRIFEVTEKSEFDLEGKRPYDFKGVNIINNLDAGVNRTYFRQRSRFYERVNTTKRTSPRSIYSVLKDNVFHFGGDRQLIIDLRLYSDFADPLNSQITNPNAKVNLNIKEVPNLPITVDKKRLSPATTLRDYYGPAGLIGQGTTDIIKTTDAVKDEVTPFSFYSSSLDTTKDPGTHPVGHILTSVGGILIENIHIDSYDLVTSLQGPFTREYVGGFQHRHTPINRVRDYSHVFGTGYGSQLDTPLTRPEAFFIDTGDGPNGHVTTPAKFKVYSPDKVDVNRPRASYYRLGASKRHYSVKHIETSEHRAGNYTFKYQYTQIADRNLRNDMFIRHNSGSLIDLTANIDFDTHGKSMGGDAFTDTLWLWQSNAGGTANSPEGDIKQKNFINQPVFDYELPDRTRDNKHMNTTSSVIFATRFSRGGLETRSRGFLDPTEQYSVYNALPYSNLTVRTYHNKSFLVHHMTALGYNSNYENASGQKLTASFHKVQRNTKHRLGPGAGRDFSSVNSGDYVNNAALEEYFDNPYIQTTIPSSDRQYKWITSSIEAHAFHTAAFLHPDLPRAITPPPLGFAHCASDITFVSASDFGSFDDGGFKSFGSTAYHANRRADGGLKGFQPVNFAGLNINLYEPLTASTNTLGYEDPKTPRKSSGPSDLLNHSFLPGNRLTFSSTNTHKSGYSALFNSLILKRQGPYGYPSWKQIRGYQHPVTRDMIKNNRHAVQDLPVKSTSHETIAAQAVITFLTNTTSVYDGSDITITDSTGKIVRFRFDDDGAGVFSPTGAVLGSLTAVQIQGLTTIYEIALEFKKAVEHKNGFDGKLEVFVDATPSFVSLVLREKTNVLPINIDNQNPGISVTRQWSLDKDTFEGSVPFNSQAFKSFIEPPLASKFKPLVVGTRNLYSVDKDAEANQNNSRTMTRKSTDQRILKVIPIVNSSQKDILNRFTFTYSNAMGSIANEDYRLKMNKEKGFKVDETTKKQDFYDSLYSSYGLSSGDEIPRTRQLTEFDYLIYDEVIWPKEENTFLDRTRTRVYFNYPNWNSSKLKRYKNNVINSQGYTIPTQSIWPLDPRQDFESVSDPLRNTPTHGEQDGAGELQNSYVTFFRNDEDQECGLSSNENFLYLSGAYGQGINIGSGSAFPGQARTYSMWIKPSNMLTGTYQHNSDYHSRGIVIPLLSFGSEPNGGPIFSDFGGTGIEADSTGQGQPTTGGSDACVIFLTASVGTNSHSPSNGRPTFGVGLVHNLRVAPSAESVGAFDGTYSKALPPPLVMWHTDMTLITASYDGQYNTADGDTYNSISQTGEQDSWYHVAVSFNPFAVGRYSTTASIAIYINGVSRGIHQVHDDGDIVDYVGSSNKRDANNYGYEFGNGHYCTYDGQSYIGWAASGSYTLSGGVIPPGSVSNINDKINSGIAGSIAGRGGSMLKVGSGFLTNGTSSYWGGIDEVSIWNKELSSTAISSLYNDYQPCNLAEHLDNEYLVSWYRMGDDNRDTVNVTRGYNPTNRIWDQQSIRFNNFASSTGTVADVNVQSSLDAYGNSWTSQGLTGDFQQILDINGSSGAGYHHGTPFGYVDFSGVSSAPSPGTFTTHINNPVYTSFDLKDGYSPVIVNHTATFACGYNNCKIYPSALYARREPVQAPNLLIVGDADWQAGAQTGKSPFYDSYDLYSDDLRRVGKDYSIIPEFRISEHMETFVDTHKGDFLADIPGFLTLTGSGGKVHTNVSSSSDNKFYKLYSHSDMLRFFKKVREDHVEKPLFDIDEENNITAIPRADTYELTLQAKGLMKFLPYDGFYPANRTLQIASQLSKSIGDKLIMTGRNNVDNSALRSFLAPLVAPGVLYNSIKAGVAVDFPIYTGSHQTKILSNPSQNRAGHANDSDYDFRVPFEAVYEPERYLARKSIYDIEAHPSASMDLVASWDGGYKNSLYKLMIHNFLAETTNFFLGDLTNVSSLPDDDPNFCNWGEEGLKPVYAMDIYLKRGSADFRVGNYQRGSAFGPPSTSDILVGTTNTSPFQLTNNNSTNQSITNDSYDPYTPPWFGGEQLVSAQNANRHSYNEAELALENLVETGPAALGALARVEFRPSKLTDEMGADLTDDGRPTLQQILSASTVSYYAYANDGTNSITGSVSTRNIMHVDASLYFKNMVEEEKAIVQDGKISLKSEIGGVRKSLKWNIGTRGEFPVLDFSAHTRTNINASADNKYRMSIGMWHQKGEIPASVEKSIVMQVQDVPEYNLSSGQTSAAETGSLAKLVGFDQNPVPIGTLKNRHKIKEAIVAVPFIERDCEQKFFKLHENSAEARKMIDKVLLSPGEEEIDGVGKSVIEMVRRMDNYVFPPSFDFVTFDGRDNQAEVEPIAMYIFEFEKELTKQDLADIWQNMPPTGLLAKDKNDINTGFQYQVSTPVTHKLKMKDELLVDVEDKMKWMVFKVKQKAAKNYYNTIKNSSGVPVIAQQAKSVSSAKEDSLQQTTFGKTHATITNQGNYYTQFEPAFSYNWPYDFFSLVELAKIETEVVINDMERINEEACEIEDNKDPAVAMTKSAQALTKAATALTKASKTSSKTRNNKTRDNKNRGRR